MKAMHTMGMGFQIHPVHCMLLICTHRLRTVFASCPACVQVFERETNREKKLKNPVTGWRYASAEDPQLMQAVLHACRCLSARPTGRRIWRRL